jgi:hypothetical protein
MNAMLASGIKSNWWLNTGGMTNDDLLAVNESAARVGPLLCEMSPADHDVAILWSYTQAAMQQKAMAASESTKVGGTQIKLMVPIPEKEGTVDSEYPINAYEIGYTYVGRLMMAHQACMRAGYPAHLIHEKMLPKGALKNYKTLIIVEQTFRLPARRAGGDRRVREGWRQGGDRQGDDDQASGRDRARRGSQSRVDAQPRGRSGARREGRQVARGRERVQDESGGTDLHLLSHSSDQGGASKDCGPAGAEVGRH